MPQFYFELLKMSNFRVGLTAQSWLTMFALGNTLLHFQSFFIFFGDMFDYASLVCVTIFKSYY